MTSARSTRTAAVVGVVSVALIEVAMAVSLAALIVRDAPPDALPRLMGALLVGSGVAACFLGVRSSLNGTVSVVQDTPIVVIAAVVVPLLADVAPDRQVSTLLVFVALSGVATGAVIGLIGLLNRGDVVRFLPTPVLDGFRLGAGWLLVVGGIEVAAGVPVSVDALDGVPGWSVALAVVVAALLGASPRFQFAPAALGLSILGVGAAFVGIAAVVSSLDSVTDAGWLLGPLDSDPRWRPLDQEVRDADWRAIAEQAPALVAVAFISITGLLLNASAVEAELDEDAEIDRDLRSTGLANMVIGAAGSSPAYLMFSGTMLARRLGLRERRTTALVGVGMLAIFVVGASVAGYTPRFLAGGLLSGLGVQLIAAWTLGQRHVARSDTVLSLIVGVVIGFVGVLEGVGLGVVLAAMLFVWRYSLIDPVQRVATGTSALSRVDRGPVASRQLQAHQDQVVVIELAGYLFFGSTARIRRAFRANLDDGVRHLVVDFHRVTGMDGSAGRRVQQLLEREQRRGVTVHVAGTAGGWSEAVGVHHVDLDHCIEAVETAVLGEEQDGDDVFLDPLVELLASAPTRRLEPGTDLFLPGEEPDGFVVVESGRISVWLDRADGTEVRVRQVRGGGLLGELGFVTGSPRSARAVVDEVSVVRVVDHAFLTGQRDGFVDDLRRLLLEHIAARLATTNDLIRSLSR